MACMLNPVIIIKNMYKKTRIACQDCEEFFLLFQHLIVFHYLYNVIIKDNVVIRTFYFDVLISSFSCEKYT